MTEKTVNSENNEIRIEKKVDGRKNLPHAFKPGNKLGGRPKGSKNKLSENFLKTLAKDFEEHGASAVEAMRKESPKDYVKVVAGLVPKQLNINSTHTLQTLLEQLPATSQDLIEGEYTDVDYLEHVEQSEQQKTPPKDGVD